MPSREIGWEYRPLRYELIFDGDLRLDPVTTHLDSDAPTQQAVCRRMTGSFATIQQSDAN